MFSTHKFCEKIYIRIYFTDETEYIPLARGGAVIHGVVT